MKPHLHSQRGPPSMTSFNPIHLVLLDTPAVTITLGKNLERDFMAIDERIMCVDEKSRIILEHLWPAQKNIEVSTGARHRLLYV